jgi:hypothetical protein
MREKELDAALQLYNDSQTHVSTPRKTPRKKKAVLSSSKKSTSHGGKRSQRPMMGTIAAVRSKDSDEESEDEKVEVFSGIGEAVGGPKGSLKAKSRLLKGKFGVTDTDSDEEEENFVPNDGDDSDEEEDDDLFSDEESDEEDDGDSSSSYED